MNNVDFSIITNGKCIKGPAGALIRLINKLDDDKYYKVTIEEVGPKVEENEDEN